MIIQRKPPRHPRRGPSCLLVVVVAVAFALGVYVVGNAEEVRDVIIPTPTPEPTRSAAEHATSAALYERDGEFEDAIEAYEQAISLSPENVNFYLNLVSLLIATGRPDDALERAEQAKVLAPSDPHVWATVASAYLANGNRLAETGDATGAGLQYQEAINAAQQATDIDPNNAEAYAYMAQALARLGIERYNEALENASLAVELAPDSPVTRRAMAIVYELTGRYDQAIEEYLLALDANPNLIDMRIDLAYLYFFTERQQQGILTLQDVIELDPGNAAAYDGLGYFYFVLGEYPDAEENAYEAVQLDPDMTRAHAHLGAARFKQNKYDTAIEELELAVSDYDEVTTSNATYFNMLGLAYYYKNRCQEAVPLFEQVLAAAPDQIAIDNAQEGMELCRQQQFESGP
ncbi:MAG: tetratricopeptide repeat protein [Candidatus Promineifilaceae bacterium]|nr:tetratricopeptide repeat protein [Candidatus Promineifilaceae bacterium]